jgi:hypothetical protein
MNDLKPAYSFSTVVSDSTKKNEFIVEFSPFTTDVEVDSVVKVTNDFDELLNFLAEMED